MNFFSQYNFFRGPFILFYRIFCHLAAVPNAIPYLVTNGFSLYRPDFSSLVQTLERLPKKRLARSPSHPIHLSRSVESVF